MRKIALHIVLIPFLFGCAKSQEDLSGTYIKTPSTNTIDTLFLYPDGSYKQVINYKSGEFYGLNENKWSVKEGRIDFMDLYLNYDFELLGEAKPKAGLFSKSSLMPSLLPVKGDKIIIDEDRKVYYKKMKN